MELKISSRRPLIDYHLSFIIQRNMLEVKLCD